MSFDALGRDQILYEIKTGYRWIPYARPTDPRRVSTVNRFVNQSEMQLAVAARCGYRLIWLFNEPTAAEFFDGMLRPTVEPREFSCLEDSDP